MQLDIFLIMVTILKFFSFLQITEPLRPKGILDKCINKLKNNQKINSAFAGYVFKKIFGLKKF